MTEPTLDEMRRACWLYYFDYDRSHGGDIDEAEAIALLRTAGQKIGCNFNIKVSGAIGQGEWNFSAWSGNQLLQNTATRDTFHAATLPEAVIRCVYHAIQESKR